MIVAFIQGGSRWKYDNEGNIYTDGNFNDSVWKRYRMYCDELRVILREEKSNYSLDEATSKFNRFDISVANNIALPDIYKPRKNILSVMKRKIIDAIIEKEVKNADCVIIRSLGNIYTNTALKYARIHAKPYIVEVTGFIWEGTWYHSLLGKIIAFPKEWNYKQQMKDVSFAIYVTNEALQRRYPCKGKMYGCSDVELLPLEDEVIERRKQKIQGLQGKFVIGTAAFLDVGWKGQRYVIQAVHKLVQKGYDIEYQLIGGGTGQRLVNLINKLNLGNRVKIVGTLQHNKVFEWMDSIDIYVQPSFQEGLCRSIVEALSRACPVIASDVGGNYELVPKKNLFRKGNVDDICECIINMMDKNNMIDAAVEGFQKAHYYEKKKLDIERSQIYSSFFSTVSEGRFK